jgi:diaminopimelate decarboxylase
MKNLLELSNTTKLIEQTKEKEIRSFEKVYEKFDSKFYEKKASIQDIVLEYCLQKDETKKTSELEAFYLINLAQVVKMYNLFTTNLPRVRPYYAVKCNSDPALIYLLHSLGAGFDCASQKEMQVVENLGLDYSKDVIFANPCKQTSHIEHARKVGVEWATADNSFELKKFAEFWPECKIVLRIQVDDSKSVCQFSSKYGAKVDDCESLLNIAKELNLNVVGVSFHVGSGCYDAKSFIKATKDAKTVFEMAEKVGYKFNLLDIGGGFPGSLDVKPNFIEISEALSPLLDELFDEDVKIIAEPGRFFASGSHTLVCNIFGKREVYSKKMLENKKQEYMYYINDGIYHSFSCLFFDHAKISIKPISTKKKIK